MKVSPVCALEIGTSRITVLVGDLDEDGNISITGKGEYALVGSELGKAPDASRLKKVLGDAEESAETSIVRFHLVMPCVNITSLIPNDTIPVLTSINDPEIQKNIALIESIECKVDEVVFSGYCSALAVTTPEQKGKGVLVLDVVMDVDGGIVTCAAFAQGTFVGVGAFKVYGKIDSEAIHIIHKYIEGAGTLNSIADGILLTGEGATTQGLANLVATTFGMKCSIGLPVGFKGLDAALNKPEYAACLGMLRYAYTDGLRKVIRPSWFKRLFGRK